jgi:hypothetical protein
LKKLSPSPKSIEVFGKPPPVPCYQGGEREGELFIQCPLPSSLVVIARPILVAFLCTTIFIPVVFYVLSLLLMIGFVTTYDFIFRQQENLVDNQKCQAGFRLLCNKIQVLHSDSSSEFLILVKWSFFIEAGLDGSGKNQKS